MHVRGRVRRRAAPPPRARAIDDATLPPMPPKAMFCISIWKEKTSAMAASASVPSRPMMWTSTACNDDLHDHEVRWWGRPAEGRLRPIGAIRRG